MRLTSVLIAVATTSDGRYGAAGWDDPGAEPDASPDAAERYRAHARQVACDGFDSDELVHVEWVRVEVPLPDPPETPDHPAITLERGRWTR